MKKVFIILLLAIAFCSCHKNRNAYIHATITGQDFRKCLCCGGYILKLDNGDSSYRFFSFPANTYIDTLHFPQSVYVSYVAADSCGPFHFITLTSVVQ